MASYSSPEFTNQRPSGVKLLPLLPEPQSLFADGDFKENVGPKLPSPGVSTSPVKSNTENGERPRASNGFITSGEESLQNAPSRQQDRSYDNNDSRMLKTQELSHRPSYTTQDSEHLQPHMAVISSTDDAGLRSYSNGSSINQASMRYEEPMENEEDPEPAPVPQLQYHHQAALSEVSNSQNHGHHAQNSHSRSNDLVSAGQSIDRHLTPTSQNARRIAQAQRPVSTYSDSGNRRSPSWGRAASAQSGRSNEGNLRPLSMLDLNNVQYPQMAPPPISLNNSELRGIVGSHASLLSTQKTLEMYRQNIKKVNDLETQYAFAVFLVTASAEAAEQEQEQGTPKRKPSPKSSNKSSQDPHTEKTMPSAQELLDEAKQILQKLSDRSYPFAQYYLADGYASGLFSKNKEQDNATAFPLFVAASKHGHAEAGYRAALCYEFGWGCRKDPAKAVQFLRHAASKNHPGAMTRLGRACLSGDLGENKYREGVKWLKRATESADIQYNAAPFYLGQLYERGCGDDIFLDEAYTAQLYTQAADLGHAEAAFKLGEAYEHGRLLCPRDPALSVHFYNCAAQKGHPEAMMALCAWYMIGAPPVLEKDENEAYEWAREAALKGMSREELRYDNH